MLAEKSIGKLFMDVEESDVSVCFQQIQQIKITDKRE